MSSVQFGPYELLARIGVGGMAELFLARQQGVAGFEKIIVIKKILPQLARLSSAEEFEQMFIDEAKLAARLMHPNIVQINDLGRVEDQFYIAMEYVNGVDLRRLQLKSRQSQTPLPIPFAIKVVSCVCDALAYVHGQKDEQGRSLGLVHRDISPHNVLVSFDGGVKLTDFGIAKVTTRVGHTRVGTIKGKLSYMSPEQVLERPLDGRSDIFSVGCMLYELLTGVLPFYRAGEHETLRAIVSENPRNPQHLRPEIPSALVTIVGRALRKETDKRYQDALPMQVDLERVLLERQELCNAAVIGEFVRGLFPDRLEAQRALIERGDGTLHEVVSHMTSRFDEPEAVETTPARFGAASADAWPTLDGPERFTASLTAGSVDAALELSPASQPFSAGVAKKASEISAADKIPKGANVSTGAPLDLSRGQDEDVPDDVKAGEDSGLTTVMRPAKLQSQRWTGFAGKKWRLGLPLVAVVVVALSIYWRIRERQDVSTTVTLSADAGVTALARSDSLAAATPVDQKKPDLGREDAGASNVKPSTPASPSTPSDASTSTQLATSASKTAPVLTLETKTKVTRPKSHTRDKGRRAASKVVAERQTREAETGKTEAQTSKTSETEVQTSKTSETEVQTSKTEVRTGKTVTQPQTGFLNIDAQPWAEVWLGKRKLGLTPLAYLELATGRHKLLLRHPDRPKAKIQWVQINPGQTAAYSVNMLDK